MILVVGATGLLGGEICRQLRRRGHPVRCLVREGSAGGAELLRQGYPIVHGDLKDPMSLRAACLGATAVITTANSMLSRRPGDSLASVDRGGSLSLIAAALAAGVRRFVYTSVSPQLSSRSPFVRYKRQVEDAVRRSGMSWTILQPSAFMQVHLGKPAGWDLAAAKATIFGDGMAPHSYIDVGDVARFAVWAFERPELRNSDLPLGGPEALSARQALRVFEQVTERRFVVRHVPVWAMQMMAALTRPFQPALSSIMTMGAEMATHGERIDVTPLLERLPEPIRLTTVREYVEQQWAVLQAHRLRRNGR